MDMDIDPAQLGSFRQQRYCVRQGKIGSAVFQLIMHPTHELEIGEVGRTCQPGTITRSAMAGSAGTVITLAGVLSVRRASEAV